MKFIFKKTKQNFKIIRNLLLVAVCVYILAHNLWPNGLRFNPQYLVENTILKENTFSVEVKEITSPELKLKAYLYEEHTNPIVSVSFWFTKAGFAYETENQQGISRLLGIMLKKGAGKYDMTAFNALLEENAIQLTFSNNKDDLFGSLTFIKSDENQAVELTNLALTQPLLAKKELQQSKEDLLQNYKYMQEEPNAYLALEANKQLFGDHPYRRNAYGKPENIKNITAKDLQQFIKKHLTLNNLIVSVSGDMNEKEAEKLVDDLFKGVSPQGETDSLERADIKINESDYHMTKQIPQSIGLFYGKGISRNDERFYPLFLAVEILSGGGGLNSRIQKSAREQKGLTYGVFASLANYDKADLIYGRFSTTPENFEQLKQIVREQWIKLGQSGITAEELQQIKNYLIASEPLRYADIDNISLTMSGMQKMNLGLDFLQKRNTYIDNVSLEDVNRVAKEYFTSDNLRFITIGNTDKMGENKENENKAD